MGICWDQYWSNTGLVQRTQATYFIAQTCSLKHAGFTAGLLASVRPTLWHSLNQPSGGPRLQTYHAGHCVHCTQAVSPSWQTHRGDRSEPRSDTRLSNALADQSYRPLPLNMPFSKLAMPLWKRATLDRLRCFSKHALPTKPGWQLAYARPTKAGWPFVLVGLSHALTLAWATL